MALPDQLKDSTATSRPLVDTDVKVDVPAQPNGALSERKALTEVEANARYPMSLSWYQKRRFYGDGPPVIRVGRRVLYPTDLLDRWFRARMTAPAAND